MTHAKGCFRSDGDWFCAKGCTHDQDQDVADLKKDLTEAKELLRDALENVDTSTWPRMWYVRAKQVVK